MSKLPTFGTPKSYKWSSPQSSINNIKFSPRTKKQTLNLSPQTKQTIEKRTQSIKEKINDNIQDMFRINDYIEIKTTKQRGTIRFIGETKFKPGIWVGIELDKRGTGKNNGTIQGVTYFKCAVATGVFVSINAIEKIASDFEEISTHDESEVTNNIFDKSKDNTNNKGESKIRTINNKFIKSPINSIHKIPNSASSLSKSKSQINVTSPLLKNYKSYDVIELQRRRSMGSSNSAPSSPHRSSTLSLPTKPKTRSKSETLTKNGKFQTQSQPSQQNLKMSSPNTPNLPMKKTRSYSFNSNTALSSPLKMTSYTNTSINDTNNDEDTDNHNNTTTSTTPTSSKNIIHSNTKSSHTSYAQIHEDSNDDVNTEDELPPIQNQNSFSFERKSNFGSINRKLIPLEYLNQQKNNKNSHVNSNFSDEEDTENDKYTESESINSDNFNLNHSHEEDDHGDKRGLVMENEYKDRERNDEAMSNDNELNQPSYSDELNQDHIETQAIESDHEDRFTEKDEFERHEEEEEEKDEEKSFEIRNYMSRDEDRDDIKDNRMSINSRRFSNISSLKSANTSLLYTSSIMKSPSLKSQSSTSTATMTLTTTNNKESPRKKLSNLSQRKLSMKPSLSEPNSPMLSSGGNKRLSLDSSFKAKSPFNKTNSARFSLDISPKDNFNDNEKEESFSKLTNRTSLTKENNNRNKTLLKNFKSQDTLSLKNKNSTPTKKSLRPSKSLFFNNSHSSRLESIPNVFNRKREQGETENESGLSSNSKNGIKNRFNRRISIDTSNEVLSRYSQKEDDVEEESDDHDNELNREDSQVESDSDIDEGKKRNSVIKDKGEKRYSIYSELTDGLDSSNDLKLALDRFQSIINSVSKQNKAQSNNAAPEGEFQNALADITQEMLKAKNESQEMRGKLTKMESRVELIMKEKETLEASVELLKSKKESMYHKYQEEITHLEDEISDKEQMAKDLEDKLAYYTEQYEIVSEKYELLMNDFEKYKEASERDRDHLQLELVEIKDRSDEEIEHLHLELEEVKAISSHEREALEQKVEEMQQYTYRLEQDEMRQRDEAEQELDASRNLAKHYEDQCNELALQIKELENNIYELDDHRKKTEVHFTNQFNQQETALEQAEEHINNLEATIEKLKKERDLVKEKTLQQFNGLVEDMEKTLNENDQSEEKLKLEIATLKSQNQELYFLLDEFTEKMESLEKENEECKVNIINCVNELDHLQEQCQEQKLEIEIEKVEKENFEQQSAKFKEESEKLKDQLKGMEKNMETQVEKLNEELYRLDESVLSLNEEKLDLEEKVKSLNEEKKELENSKNEKEKDCQNHQKEIENLHVQLENFKELISLKELELNEKQQMLDTSTILSNNESKKWQEKVEHIQSELEANQLTLTKFEQEIKEKEELYEKEVLQSEDFKHEIETLNLRIEENTKIIQEMDHIKEENTAMKLKLETTQKDMEKLSKEHQDALSSSEDIVKKFETKLFNIRDQLEDSEERVEKLEIQIKEKEALISNQKVEFQEYETKIEVMTSQLKSKEEDIQDLKGKLGEKEGSIHGLQDKLKTNDESIAELQELVQKKEENIKGLKGQLDEKEGNIQGLHDKLKEKEDLLKQEINHLNEKLNQLTKEKQDIFENKDKTLQEYQEKITQSTNLISDLKREHEKEMDKVEQTLSQLKNEHKEKVSHYEKTISQLKSEYQEKTHELEDSLSQLKQDYQKDKVNSEKIINQLKKEKTTELNELKRKFSKEKEELQDTITQLHKENDEKAKQDYQDNLNILKDKNEQLVELVNEITDLLENEKMKNEKIILETQNSKEKQTVLINNITKENDDLYKNLELEKAETKKLQKELTELKNKEISRHNSYSSDATRTISPNEKTPKDNETAKDLEEINNSLTKEEEVFIKDTTDECERMKREILDLRDELEETKLLNTMDMEEVSQELIHLKKKIHQLTGEKAMLEDENQKIFEKYMKLEDEYSHLLSFFEKSSTSSLDPALQRHYSEIIDKSATHLYSYSSIVHESNLKRSNKEISTSETTLFDDEERTQDNGAKNLNLPPPPIPPHTSHSFSHGRSHTKEKCISPASSFRSTSSFSSNYNNDDLYFYINDSISYDNPSDDLKNFESIEEEKEKKDYLPMNNKIDRSLSCCLAQGSSGERRRSELRYILENKKEPNQNFESQEKESYVIKQLPKSNSFNKFSNLKSSKMSFRSLNNSPRTSSPIVQIPPLVINTSKKNKVTSIMLLYDVLSNEIENDIKKNEYQEEYFVEDESDNDSTNDEDVNEQEINIESIDENHHKEAIYC